MFHHIAAGDWEPTQLSVRINFGLRGDIAETCASFCQPIPRLRSYDSPSIAISNDPSMVGMDPSR